MNKNFVALRIFLVFSIFTQLCFANTEPPSHEFSPEEQHFIESVSQQRAREARQAETDLHGVRDLKVGHYFAGIATDKVKWRAAQQKLLADAVAVHTYQESQSDDAEFSDYVKKRLEPFVKSLTYKKVHSFSRGNQIAEPIEEWSVETLVVATKISYLASKPDFLKNNLKLISGKHLLGATASAGFIAVSATGIYLLYQAGHFNPYLVGAAVGSFLGSRVAGSLDNGLFGPLVNSFLGWFIQPASENLKKRSLIAFGPLEQKLNHLMDKNEKDEGPGAPNIATLESDGINFAGMTTEEQKQNWEKNLHEWVIIAKTYGQVMRDTHHVGRFWAQVSWMDENAIANTVYGLNHQLLTYDLSAKAILIPYESGIMSNASISFDERRQEKSDLQEHYHAYQVLHEKKWLEINQSESDLAKIDEEMATHRDFIEKILTRIDLMNLDKFLEEKRVAVAHLFTAVTLNEVRSFNGPETNRNLEGEARKAYRTIRGGYGLQEYVNKYENHIQLTMQKMGYANKVKVKNSCENLFR